MRHDQGSARIDRWADWTVAGTLYHLELYNGFGYRNHHPSVKTPYLWSFSNQYTAGKYVADGTWSPTAVSKQCGAAVLLRRLAEKGHSGFSDQMPPGENRPAVVAYARTRPHAADVIAAAQRLQEWLNTHPGIFVRVDGWAGEKSSDAYKSVTGRFLPGDPRA